MGNVKIDIVIRLTKLGFTRDDNKYTKLYVRGYLRVSFASNIFYVIDTGETKVSGNISRNKDFNKLDQYIKLLERSHRIKKVLNGG